MEAYFWGKDHGFLSKLQETVSKGQPFLLGLGYVIALAGPSNAEKHIRRAKDRPDRPISLWGPPAKLFGKWGRSNYSGVVTRIVNSEIFEGAAFLRFKVWLPIRYFPWYFGLPSAGLENQRVQVLGGKRNTSVFSMQQAAIRGLGLRRADCLLVTSANPRGQPTLYKNREAISWAEETGIEVAFLLPEDLNTQHAPHVSYQIIEAGVPFVERRKGNQNILPDIRRLEGTVEAL